MGLQNFYEVTSKTEALGNGLKNIEIKVNKNHQIFEGHFPNNPVMPGVCMMHIVKEITSTYVGQDLFMEKCSNVKFISLINPEIDDKLRLEIEIHKEGTQVKIKSSTFFLNKQALKMSVVYKTLN